MATIDEALQRLGRSRFRSRFHLTDKDRAYIRDKGWDIISRHGADFIAARLAPAEIPNDGRQTPMRGHPIFVAQHACACCCRGCLAKWYHVPEGRALTPEEQRRILNLLLAWLRREYGQEDSNGKRTDP